MDMTALIIANEHANWGAGRHRVRQATEFLRRQGWDFSLAVTGFPGHAQELAAAAAAQRTATVVVIGGDGTVNEVINGLVRSERDYTPCVGIIPAGSSNDFSKSLGLPQDLEGACRAILKGRVRSVDVGRAGVHCFASASCAGYFARVAARSLEARRLRGSLRYVLPALGVIREMTEGWEMEVRTEDGRVYHGTYAVLLVGNAPRFGGLTMLPRARPDDGVLEGLLIEMMSRWEALRLIPRVYRQALDGHRRVQRFQATSFSVTLRRPTQLCNDGEMVPGVFESIDYRLLPQRLPVYGGARE